MRVSSGSVSRWCVTDKSLQWKLTGLEAGCQNPENKRRAFKEKEQKGVSHLPPPCSHFYNFPNLDRSCIQVTQIQAHAVDVRTEYHYQIRGLVLLPRLCVAALHLSAASFWCNHSLRRLNIIAALNNEFVISLGDGTGSQTWVRSKKWKQEKNSSINCSLNATNKSRITDNLINGSTVIIFQHFFIQTNHFL